MRLNNSLLLIVIFLFVSLFSCTETSKESHKTREERSTTQEKIDSTDFFGEGIPEDSSYFALAMKYAKVADTTKTLEYLRKAYELNPDKEEYLYYLGYFNYALGKFEKSKKFFKELLSKNKKNAQAYYYLGGIALAEKKLKIASQYFRKAFELEPLNTEYNYSLCLSYQLRGILDKARKHCELALQADTTHIKSMELLFDIYLSQNEGEKALLLVDKILTMDARQPLGRFLMGKYYHQKAHKLAAEKKFQESALWIAKALHQYDLALARDTTFTDAYYNRAFAYVELKQYSQALEDFKKVSKLNPTDYRTYFMIGSIYEFYKDYQEAARYYEKALELKPDFQEAKQALEEVRKKLKT